LIIGIIVITFINIILVIGSPFQITSNNLVQNNGHQQKVYATPEDDNGGDDVEDEKVENDGIDDGDTSNNDDDDSGEVDNDNEEGNDGKISDGESDKSDDKSSSSSVDLFNEELTAENPPEIAGEIITGELTPNFGITDNLQVAPSLSTDDQTIQAPQAAEEFNSNVKLEDLLKEQSQTDSIQEIPLQTTEPPVSKSFDPNVNRLTNSQLEQLESSSPAVESLNPFVDLDDLLKEQPSTELVESTVSQLNSSGKEDDSEGTSTGILTNRSPKNPSDSFISSREPVVIPGPSYSEEDPALEECVVEHCNIPFYDDEICRNGIDDDDDGRVDEDPYCTVIPGKSGPAPDTDGILTPEQSTGPSPFGTK
jgi:hypothetical protein